MQDGCAELQRHTAQLTTTQKQLNISRNKLERAQKMQGRLDRLCAPVKSELVTLMAQKAVSLEDFNSCSLKVLKFVHAAEAVKLLRAFFSHPDFDKRNKDKALVCPVLLVLQVRTVVCVPSKCVLIFAVCSSHVFCTYQGKALSSECNRHTFSRGRGAGSAAAAVGGCQAAQQHQQQWGGVTWHAPQQQQQQQPWPPQVDSYIGTDSPRAAAAA